MEKESTHLISAVNSAPPGRINFTETRSFSHFKISYAKKAGIPTGFIIEPLMQGQLSATAK